jgi:HSP20 family protein
VDIIDDPDAPILVAIFELPGLVNKEINVTIKDGYLIIHGNRQSSYGDSAIEQRSCPSDMNIDPESCRQAKMSLRELRFGPFLRRVKIPYGTKVSI